MNCPRCRAVNADDARFCEDCGAPLDVTCPRCGAAVTPGKRFCRACGAPLAAPAPAPDTYTPPHLARKILTSRAALEGERKQVSVLFVDVSGFTSLASTLDPEDVHALMRNAFERMLPEVHRYEGTVNQFLGDGIMALFGAPIAHEDHALRAVRAALGIRRALADYADDLGRQRGVSFRVRLGLNTGLVVVGAIGDDLRMDYTAVGDTTNVAARMQQTAAPGEILVSDATYRLIDGYVDAEERVRALQGGRGPRRAPRRVGAARRRVLLLRAVPLGESAVRRGGSLRRAVPGARARQERSRARRDRPVLPRVELRVAGQLRRALSHFAWIVDALDGAGATQSFGLSGLPFCGACGLAAWAHSLLGEADEAFRLLDRGDAVATSTNHLYSMTTLRLIRGTALLELGRPEEAVGRLEDALAVCRERNFAGQTMLALTSVARTYALVGRAAEGLPLAREAVQRQERVKAYSDRGWNVGTIAEVALAAGRLDDAEAATREALGFAERHGERAWEALIRLVAAGIALERGRPDDALAEADRVVACAEALELRPAVARGRLVRAAALARLGRAEDARADAARARDLFRALDMPYWLARAESEARALA